jgi:hypothetical protein
MSQTRIPKGIILLALVYLLIAGSLVLVGGVFALSPATLRPFGFRPNPEASVRLAGLCFFGGTGVLAIAIGYGLWNLRRWARSTVIASGLCVLGRTMVVLVSGSGNSTPNTLWTVAASVVAVGVLWYLWIPTVRAAFGAPRKNAIQ